MAVLLVEGVLTVGHGVMYNHVLPCHSLSDIDLSSSQSNVSSSKIQVEKSDHVKWIELIGEKR